MVSERGLRYLSQLEHNLRSLEEVQPVIDVSNTLKHLISEQGFGLVVAEINANMDVMGFRRRLTKKSIEGLLFPDQDFADEYQQKHTIYPIGVGVIISRKKWKKTKTKIGTESDGYVCYPRFFSESEIGLDKVGFMMHSDEGDEPINKEHELMHMDLVTYSANHPLLVGFVETHSYSRSSIRVIMENELKGELIAYRNELVGKSEEIANFLAEGRLCFYVEWLTDIFVDYHHYQQELRRRVQNEVIEAVAPLGLKVREATVWMEYLVVNVPSQILTPLLFSLGSPTEDIKRGYITSTLDDIVWLGETFAGDGLPIEKVAEVISGKGYEISF